MTIIVILITMIHNHDKNTSIRLLTTITTTRRRRRIPIIRPYRLSEEIYLIPSSPDILSSNDVWRLFTRIQVDLAIWPPGETQKAEACHTCPKALDHLLVCVCVCMLVVGGGQGQRALAEFSTETCMGGSPRD